MAGDASLQQLRAEIESLSASNRASPDAEAERRLLELRHQAGIRLLDAAASEPEHPRPASEDLPEASGLPEIRAADVTPGLLRAGILRDGALLVRGLVERDDAMAFASRIRHAFEERRRQDEGQGAEAGIYEEFAPDPGRYGEVDGREWVKQGGGLLAADSPALCFEMLELFRSVGVPDLVEGYLGEPALISAHKTTLREAQPSVGGAWHQDGAFMGPVRSINLWLSLSRCGDEAPGMDLVPRRLDELVTAATDEAAFPNMVSQAMAERAAGDVPIIRPIFEPGDALFFDELFLHKTASDPAMPNPRYAIENWFFGGSVFPADYAPLAV